jgi:hypothetical protein
MALQGTPYIYDISKLTVKLMNMQLSNLPTFDYPGHISFKSFHTILQLSQKIGWHGAVFR